MTDQNWQPDGQPFPQQPMPQPWQQPAPQQWQPQQPAQQPWQTAPQPWQQPVQQWQQPAQPYAVAPYPGAPLGQPMVAPKNPAVSLLVSFFFPGVGSMVNGEIGKGIGILLGYFTCILLSWLVLPILGALGLWVWGMVDAYQGAQRWNALHGIIS